MKLILILFTFGLLSIAYSQNLVIDGGLEDTIKCPQTIGRFYHPSNTNERYTAQWRATTLASPDYNNLCGYNSFQPRTGRGYAGVIYYDPTEYREYITALLSQPLVSGEQYYIEYYIARNASSTLAIDEVQVHFSTGVPLDLTFPISGPLNLVPHLTASTAPTAASYEKVSGCFTANGGEDAMTFGNFQDNANTTTTTVSGSGSVNTYYFLDDVSVIHVNDSITQNGATLSAVMTGVSYLWVDCNNSYSPVPGETNQSFTPSSSGSYACILTYGDCTDTTECKIVDYTGIYEVSSNKKTLVRITDLMGRTTKFVKNEPLLFIYEDGTVERKLVIDLNE